MNAARPRATRLALAALLALAPLAAAAQSNILLGIFPGVTPFDATAAWLGKKPAVQVMFTDWDPNSLAGAKSTLYDIWNSGSVPLLTWEVFTNTAARTAPANIDYLIARGDYDNYIRSFGQMLHDYLDGADGVWGDGDDRRVFLRFAHEMNGNWYPWSANYPGANQTPADYINMWQHVHQIFAGMGLDAGHVRWVWAPMNCDCSASPLESYYPGSGYVDWAGVDAYNWGTSQSWSAWTQPDQLLDAWLGRVATVAPGKPLAIPEIGTTSAGGDKLQWMRDMAGFTSYYNGPNNAKVKLVSYFNIDKETDWAVFGGGGDESFNYDGVSYRGYSSYRQMMGWSNYLAAPGNNPRILTDAQFQGQF